VKRMRTENLKANLLVGDIMKLPFENNFFDCVLDVECLYANNWKNSSLIMREIYRVLKQNGLFYSRTFSSEMFVGDAFPISNYYEYHEVEEGPLSGKGFVRLINRDLIKELYGKILDIRSIDLLEHTRDNGRVKISEWIITAEKKC
jgi:ubiquinone/menaquinone biosynthesis C-methylase UbiE